MHTRRAATHACLNHSTVGPISYPAQREFETIARNVAPYLQ